MGERRQFGSKLDIFLLTHKLKPAVVAREAGISRQHLGRIRAGKADPTIMVAMRIRDACGRLISEQISIHDLFDV